MNIQGFRNQLIMKREQYRMLKRQRGMTLLEIIIVLAIIGVISAGVVVLAQRAFDSKAIADLANNANIVRVAMKDAYGLSGRYPAEKAAETQALTTATIRKDTVTPIGRLVALGKLSPDEARNAISGNYINIGAGKIGSRVDAGYYIVLNGLNQQQCRGLLSQLGNQWDFVQVAVTGYPSGTYTALNNIALDKAVSPFTPNADGTIGAGTGGGATAGTPVAGILRSLNANGNTLITPDGAILTCGNNANNALILGSR